MFHIDKNGNFLKAKVRIKSMFLENNFMMLQVFNCIKAFSNICDICLSLNQDSYSIDYHSREFKKDFKHCIQIKALSLRLIVNDIHTQLSTLYASPYSLVQNVTTE